MKAIILIILIAPSLASAQYISDLLASPEEKSLKIQERQLEVQEQMLRNQQQQNLNNWNPLNHESDYEKAVRQEEQQKIIEQAISNAIIQQELRDAD